MKLVTIGAAGCALSPRADAVMRSEWIVDCRVAGVPYQDIDVFKLRQGSPVIVKRDRYGEEACYKVLDMNGATIGFVPRAILPLLEDRKVKSAWLSKVNRYAVPWNQVELAILLE